MRNLTELLQCRALEQPERLGYRILHRDGSVSELDYAALHRRAAAVAQQLSAAVTPGSRVLIVQPPGEEFLASFFGCVYAGVIAVPVYPPEPVRLDRALPRLRAIMVACDAAALCCNEAMARSVDHATLQGLQRIVTDPLREPESAFEPAKTDPESIAFLQFTSGSTGVPKGVMLKHATLLAHLRTINAAFEHTADSSTVFWLPPYHDMGLIGGILAPLQGGYPTTLMPPVDFLIKPERWLQAIARYRATTSGAPNFAYELAAQRTSPELRETLDLRDWRVAFCGAEPVRADTLARFAETFAISGFQARSFFPCYGLAEACLMVSGGPPGLGSKIVQADRSALTAGRFAPAYGPQSAALVSCGRPLREHEVAIVDPSTREALTASGSVGEIWFRGASVASGYWGEEAAPQSTFAAYTAGGDGPYLRTGDLGFLLQDELFVAGRLKDLIIVRGRNYHPHDIEAVVERSHPALRAGGCAAFSIEDGGEERLVLVAEVSPNRLSDPAEVERALRGAVADTLQVRAYAVALVPPRTIAKTTSGKPQRWSVRSAYLDGTLPLVSLSRDARRVAATVRGGLTKAPVDFEHVLRWLRERIADAAGMAPADVDIGAPASAHGVDSVVLTSLAAELELWTGRTLPPTEVLQQPSLSAWARRIVANDEPQPMAAVAERAIATTEPIAIVGMACRFPLADTLDDFWALLKDGRCAIRPLPAQRKADWYGDALGAPEPIAGFLDDVSGFDAEFFGVNPLEATWTDPQQRLVLEVTQRAFEDAGFPRERLAGSDTGVFVGIGDDDYAAQLLGQGGSRRVQPYALTGNSRSIAANRVSYVFDLRGPSVAIDSACSSSLVAVHLACESIRSGECESAVAAGVHLTLNEQSFAALGHAGMLSPTHSCRPFDADANGYARGEGCGVVVLKRLSAAERDGDRILAVVRGSAVAQDGHTPGLTVPRRAAQARVIARALAQAQLTGDAIGLVEAHGTGTPLGDPIEVEALAEALGAERSSECHLGSLKSNIGHLEAAAGIAGLIKSVLCLQHRQLVPQACFARVNPLLPLSAAKFAIPTRASAWESAGLRRAGVSSFGFGGTNAHVVLEEAPPPQAAAQAPQQPCVFVVSARSSQALRARADAWRARLASGDAGDLYAVCRDAALRSSHYACRRAWNVSSIEALTSALESHAAADANGPLGRADAPPIAFAYAGSQGLSWPKLRELCLAHEIVMASIAQADALLAGELDRSLLALVLDPSPQRREVHESPRYVWPAWVAAQIACTKLWQSWGLRPDAVMGSSLGQLAALYAAGSADETALLKLAARGGALVEALPERGDSILVFLSPELLARELSAFAGCEIAAIQGDRRVIVSGPAAPLGALAAELRQRGVTCRNAALGCALHSALMAPALHAFTQEVARVELAATRVPCVLDSEGTALAAGWLPNAKALSRFLCEPTQLQAACAQLRQLARCVLEIGTSAVLTELARTASDQATVSWLPTLCEGREIPQSMCDALAELYSQGCELNWSAIYPSRAALLRPPPGHPLDRRRHWLQASSELSHSASAEDVTLCGLRIATRALGGGAQPYLDDHIVRGVTIAPAAELLVTLQELLSPQQEAPLQLDRVQFERPVELAESSRLEVVIAEHAADSGALSVLRAPTTGPSATCVTASFAFAPSAASSLGELSPRCSISMPVQDLYARMHDVGLQYGASFRGIVEAHYGDGEALVKVRCPSTAAGLAQHARRAIVLDGCFQAVAVALWSSQETRAFVPAAIERVIWLDALPDEVTAYVRVGASDGQESHKDADIWVFDARGRVLVELRALRCRALPTPRQTTPQSDVRFVVDAWQPKPIPEQAALLGRWLFIELGGADLNATAAYLGLMGCDVVTLAAAPASELRERIAESDWTGIVFGSGTHVDDPAGGPGASFAALLELTQCLTGADRRSAPALWVVTRGAQDVLGGESVAPPSAALWGFARSVRSEHRSFELHLIDLDPHDVASAEQLAEELCHGRADEVAYRIGGRYERKLAWRELEAARETDAPAATACLLSRDGPRSMCLAWTAEPDGFAFRCDVDDGSAARTVWRELSPMQAHGMSGLLLPGVRAYLLARLALESLARVTAGERVVFTGAWSIETAIAVQVALQLAATVAVVRAAPLAVAWLRALGVQCLDAAEADEQRADVLVQVGAQRAARAGASLRPLGRYVVLLGDHADPASRIVPSGVTGAAMHVVSGAALTHVGDAWLSRTLSDAWTGLQSQTLELVDPVRRTGVKRTRVIAPTRTYVLSGATGALGLQVARWLAERGADTLALIARHEPDASAAEGIAALRRAGVRVHVLIADVAEREALQTALHRLRAEGAPPISGVLHLAGVLADAALRDQSLAALELTWRPKAVGAWNLHQLTLDEPLDFFVMFSSIAHMLGSAGQANYAAANGFLQGLAALRRSQRRPALAIHWGPWAGSGMAAASASRLRATGLELIPPARGLDALDALLLSDETSSAAFMARWSELSRLAKAQPALAGLIDNGHHVETQDGCSKDVLIALPEPARIDRLTQLLVREIAALMELPETELETEVPIADLGFDSMLALELRDRLEVKTGLKIAMTRIAEEASVRTFAAEIASKLSHPETAAEAPRDDVGAPASQDATGAAP